MPLLYTKSIAIMSLASIGVVCAAHSVNAEPLDTSQCDTVKTSREKLIGSGVLADIARGPAWAIINVSADRLKEIQQFIELEEQFNFRCREFAPRKIKPTGPNAAAADLKINPEIVPQAKPKRKPSAENSRVAPAADKPKPKAREKSAKTDAYVPPPGSESSIAAPGLTGTETNGPAENAKSQPSQSSQSSGTGSELPPLTP